MKFERVMLGDISEVVSKGTTPTTLGIPFVSSGVPFLRAEDVTGGPVDSKSVAFHIDEATHNSTLARSQLKPGDLLITIAGTLGRLGYVPDNAPPLNCNQAVAFVRPKPNLADTRYLLYACQHNAVLQSLLGQQRVGTIGNLNLQQVRELYVPLPPLPEQQRIAAILDKADRLRRLRRYALGLGETYLQSVFLEMFGDPRRNLKAWPQKTLQDLGRVTTGSTPPTERENMFGGSIPFVTPSDLSVDTQHTQRFVTEEGASESRTVRAGSTLVCCIGATIGKMDKAQVRCAFNQQINAVEWSAEVNDDFGLQQMKFYSDLIALRGTSTTLPILKKSEFEQLIATVPPLVLQERYAAIAQQYTRLHTQQRESLRQSEVLFQALLHEAFQG